MDVQSSPGTWDSIRRNLELWPRTELISALLACELHSRDQDRTALERLMQERKKLSSEPLVPGSDPDYHDALDRIQNSISRLEALTKEAGICISSDSVKWTVDSHLRERFNRSFYDKLITHDRDQLISAALSHLESTGEFTDDGCYAFIDPSLVHAVDILPISSGDFVHPDSHSIDAVVASSSTMTTLTPSEEDQALTTLRKMGGVVVYIDEDCAEQYNSMEHPLNLEVYPGYYTFIRDENGSWTNGCGDYISKDEAVADFHRLYQDCVDGAYTEILFSEIESGHLQEVATTAITKDRNLKN